jgi:hypothetical protein
VESLRELWWLYALGVTTTAWIAFADHPTAHNLRTAVIDTLDL